MYRTIILMAALGVASCATPVGFEWGNYDQALYNYSRSPEARAAYVKAVESAIQRGKRNGRVAPGLQAELGYMKLEAGDIEGAVALFEGEASTFPESKLFMQKAIAAARTPPTEAAVSPAPESNPATPTTPEG